MARNVHVINLFRFLSMFLTVLGVALAMGARFQGSSLTNLITFTVLLVLTVVGGGFISLRYVRLLKWVLQHLHISEDQSWLTAFGISAICDVLLVRHHLIAIVVLSIVSMLLMSIVAAGWDRDRCGMTEGLFVGFGKLFLVYLITQKILSSAFCGAVLLIAIISKFTENSATGSAVIPLNVGNADSL